MKSIFGYGLAAAAALSAPDFAPISAPSYGPEAEGHRNNGASRFDPRINRHTGKHHEHRREIARNLKRASA